MSVNYHLFQNLLGLNFKMEGYFLHGFTVLKFDIYVALQRGVMIENHHKKLRSFSLFHFPSKFDWAISSCVKS